MKLNMKNDLNITLDFDEIMPKDTGNYSNVKLIYRLDANPIQLALLLILFYVPIQIHFLNYEPN
jgi:hypothetical protein